MLTMLAILIIGACVLALAWCLVGRRRETQLGRRSFGRKPEPETPPARRRSRWQQTYRHFGSSKRLIFSPAGSESSPASPRHGLLVSPCLVAGGAGRAEGGVLRREEDEEGDRAAAWEVYLALVSTSEGGSDTDSSEF